MSDRDNEQENQDREPEVEVFHRKNRLKIKAGGDPKGGPGLIDPKAVERANTVIETKAKLYPGEVEASLKNLNGIWASLLKKEGQDSDEELEALYHTANQIKDLASTFGYQLMQHFALSLRGFTENLDLTREPHRTIVQAHIDVMWVVFHRGIRDYGDKRAEELKAIVSKAIEKHS